MSNDKGKRAFWSYVCALLLSATAPLLAQQTSRTLSGDDAAVALAKEKAQTQVTQPSGPAMESTVDPERYYVGPSDVLSVNIWMSPSMNLNLTVTPEGTLIIPTVGEVTVSGMTLAMAKEKIIALVRKRYLTAEITVTLVKPRMVVVTVSGQVLNEGLYTLSAIDRANKAIEEANKPNHLQTEEQTDRVIGAMSLREIVLRHRDGSFDHVDVVKYLSTREERWNPFLREGDVIVVPRKNSAKNVFGVYGEVNAPGRYEYVPGDSLHDVFQISQGFTRLAIKDSVEFARLNLDGTVLMRRTINAAAIVAGQETDFPLEPGDRIIVRAKRELREDFRVTVQGEVVYPGVYPITRNQTRLSELVRQAGGFTEFAALKSAELIRRSILPTDLETERLLSLRGGVATIDSLDYNIETDLRLLKENVTVDFGALFLKGDSTQDVLLQGEDYLIVPSLKRTVYVFGQIVSPGHIPLVAGQSADYYVSKAGGYTDRARRGDVRIVKGKTKQWLEPGATVIEDGDYVWVPKSPDRPFAYYMMIASQTASVLGVIIGVAVVIVQVTK